MENVSADFTINENQPLQAEYTLGESEHFDCTFELFASGTVWGSIDGNIENQTDLWEILSSKADTETVNHDLEVIEGEISDLSYTVDNNYTTLVNRLENDELAISNNANEITSINNTILTYGDIVTYDASNFATSAQGALANTALQPNDNISELVNNVGYITSASLPTVNNPTITIQRNGVNIESFSLNQASNETINITVPTQASDIGALPSSTTISDLTTQAQMDALNSGATSTKINQIASNTQAISTETENRQDADNNLQSQIDAITASSDVTDIVGTYAQLQAYDTSTLPPNSIIKVLQDEHRNNETTYYRWVITGGVGAWVLIGEEGPYYTKSEADGKFVPQTRTVNGKALSTNITLDASDVGALPSSTVIPVVDQTFDGTSANAQSGVAIQNELETNYVPTYSDSSIYINSDASIELTAYDSNSVTVNGTPVLLQDTTFANGANFYIDGIGAGYYDENGDAIFSITSSSSVFSQNGNGDNFYIHTVPTGLYLVQNQHTTPLISVNSSGNLTIGGEIVSTQTWVTNQGYTSNVGTVTSVNNTQPDANGNVTIPTGGTVDQTYDGNSSNAQSGVAINGANFVQNSATANYALTLLGTATNKSGSINIGTSSSSSAAYGIAIGYNSSAETSQGALALGYNSHATAQNSVALGTASNARAKYAVQIGYGTNSTANTVSFGFFKDGSPANYRILDGTTGLIPDARISTNIARATDIPTATSDLTNDSGFITGITSSDVTTALGYTPYNASNPSGYITSSDLPTNHVTTDTAQNITGTKTFVGQKKIAFKQSGTSDKLGFTLYNNSGTEKGYLEYNPSNTVDNVPLMTLGNYAVASGGLTHVGFRKYSGIGNASGAYNLLTPLISDARTPFNLTTTYTNFYLPLGFTDGTTTIKTAKSGLVDLSSIIPTATSDLTNDSGFITSIPTATSSTLGMVQPDNTTITIDSNGVISSSGASRNVGEIIQSTIPLTDAGLHLLDGSLLTYGSYQAFIDYIADLYDSGNYDDIFETEANWQSSVTTYGVCGKFVYDSVNQTIRLPKITGFTEGTIDPTVLGNLVEAGLPNITGNFAIDKTSYGWSSSYVDGAFYNNGTTANGNSATQSGQAPKIGFSASRSSSIYGNSTTVQPQAIKVLYYIVIANTTKTAIQVDIDEIATDLNGKAGVDLANVNDSGSSLGASWAMPSSTSIDLTLGSSGTGYIAPSEGYFSFVSGNSGSYPKNVELENLTSNISSSAHNSVNNGWLRCSIPAKKGDQVNIWYQNLDFKSLKFVYAQGSESEAN